MKAAKEEKTFETINADEFFTSSRGDASDSEKRFQPAR
jgi:hypothetical protein